MTTSNTTRYKRVSGKRLLLLLLLLLYDLPIYYNVCRERTRRYILITRTDTDSCRIHFTQRSCRLFGVLMLVRGIARTVRNHCLHPIIFTRSSRYPYFCRKFVVPSAIIRCHDDGGVPAYYNLESKILLNTTRR